MDVGRGWHLGVLASQLLLDTGKGGPQGKKAGNQFKYINICCFIVT